MDQQARVLRALELAGEHGVTAADFSGVKGTPDGGPPIMRFAARVMELRQAGHTIVQADVPRRDKCKVMVLRAEVRPLVAAVPDPEPRLFGPPSAIFGDAA